MVQTNYLHENFSQIEANGWVILSLPIDFCQDLLATAQDRLKAGLFKPAVVTNDSGSKDEIRSDMTSWLQENSNDPTEVKLFSFLNKIKNELSEFFRFPLSQIECHYAIYEPGTKYDRHSDQTKENNKRFFSFVIYLNEKWQSHQGGQLIGYAADGSILFQTEPMMGQMIIFKSELQHEVLPAQRQRWSVTGWFRR